MPGKINTTADLETFAKLTTGKTVKEADASFKKMVFMPNVDNSEFSNFQNKVLQQFGINSNDPNTVEGIETIINLNTEAVASILEAWAIGYPSKTPYERDGYVPGNTPSEIDKRILYAIQKYFIIDYQDQYTWEINPKIVSRIWTSIQRADSFLGVYASRGPQAFVIDNRDIWMRIIWGDTSIAATYGKNGTVKNIKRKTYASLTTEVDFLAKFIPEFLAEVRIRTTQHGFQLGMLGVDTENTVEARKNKIDLSDPGKVPADADFFAPIKTFVKPSDLVIIISARVLAVYNTQVRPIVFHNILNSLESLGATIIKTDDSYMGANFAVKSGEYGIVIMEKKALMRSINIQTQATNTYLNLVTVTRLHYHGKRILWPFAFGFTFIGSFGSTK